MVFNQKLDETIWTSQYGQPEVSWTVWDRLQQISDCDVDTSDVDSQSVAALNRRALRCVAWEPVQHTWAGQSRRAVHLLYMHAYAQAHDCGIKVHGVSIQGALCRERVFTCKAPVSYRLSGCTWVHSIAFAPTPTSRPARNSIGVLFFVTGTFPFVRFFSALIADWKKYSPRILIDFLEILQTILGINPLQFLCKGFAW